MQDAAGRARGCAHQPAFTCPPALAASASLSCKRAHLPRSVAVAGSRAGWNGSPAASSAAPGTNSMTSTHAARASCSARPAARRPSSRLAACAALNSGADAPCARARAPRLRRWLRATERPPPGLRHAQKVMEPSRLGCGDSRVWGGPQPETCDAGRGAACGRDAHGAGAGGRDARCPPSRALACLRRMRHAGAHTPTCSVSSLANCSLCAARRAGQILTTRHLHAARPRSPAPAWQRAPIPNCTAVWRLYFAEATLCPAEYDKRAAPESGACAGVSQHGHMQLAGTPDRAHPVSAAPLWPALWSAAVLAAAAAGARPRRARYQRGRRAQRPCGASERACVRRASWLCRPCARGTRLACAAAAARHNSGRVRRRRRRARGGCPCVFGSSGRGRRQHGPRVVEHARPSVRAARRRRGGRRRRGRRGWAAARVDRLKEAEVDAAAGIDLHQVGCAGRVGSAHVA